ncbi:MAG: helix-turn-helix domain-containing protein [Chloroflexi bacterium]|nr:MAG: helix-turn-helix domain-containing protein [Chloroflexota bacterium]
MTQSFRHRQPTIGVLVGWQVYWTPSPYSYLTPIFRGICLAARKHDCNVLLACGMGSSADPSDRARPAWPAVALDSDFVPVGPWNTDGLIVINPLLSQGRTNYIQDLHQAGFPIIFIGKGEAGPTISADNFDGILQAIRHFVEHGHQQIAFIAGNAGDVQGDSGERLRAYTSAMQNYGLKSSPNLIAYGDHTFSGGYNAMRELLAANVQFTAMMASNDESALGAMRALKEANRQIPQDVAVIGFDDRPETLAEVPALTSVHISLFGLGYQSLKAMSDYFQGKKPALASFNVPTRLVIRHSCGCRRSEARNFAPAEFAMFKDFTSIAQAMTQAVLVEAQHLDADEILGLCQQLVDGFVTSLKQKDSHHFDHTLNQFLQRRVFSEDDMHIWQAAISLLFQALPAIISASDESHQQLAFEMVDQARITIDEALMQQHRQYVFNQAWTINRIGALNAHLLTALDEKQIFEILANHLPAMGIQEAAVGFFEGEEDDPFKWSDLHILSKGTQFQLRSLTCQFPPEGAYRNDQAFSLAVLPLISQLGIVGFTAFDTTSIELLGAITQQIAAALNSARLYAEATEGRRLAEETDRLKSRFLSTVSHELRTPLSLIVGLSDILLQKSNKKGSALPAPYLKDIEQIYASGQHLGRLIQDVLDLASSEAGQLQFNSERLNLSETLKIIASTGKQLAAERGLAWQEFFPEEGPWVWGDRTRLRQVVLNLISNAVKFTSQGEVQLVVESKDGYAIVSVSDTGIGIPLAEQQTIFDEFHRSERTLSRGYSGMGLGLAISKRLVEMHGGEIGVGSSGKEGAGSTFYFKLPLIEPNEDQDDLLLDPALGQRVLLITHNIEVGKRLRDRLLESGLEAQLMPLDTLDNRLAHPRESSASSVVVDISMTPNRGWQILKQLKDNPVTREIPILFYAFRDEKGAVLELDYLTKPIRPAELARALDQQSAFADDDKKEKVLLIVDDNASTLEMYVRIVQSQSTFYRTLKARNGREALAAMEKERPDLVLLDLMMPELDGFGVLEAMRANESTRDVPVIVLTGQVLTERDMARLNRGVATILEKGMFSVEDTLAQIEAVLVGKQKLGSEAQRLVRRAMAYLHEHYTEALSREELARHVGLNSDYLTYCFRKELGMTPIAYLNRYRINQAKQLLTERQMSITEVGMAVGFSDSGYFSRVFRKEVGMSPEAYRRS